MNHSPKVNTQETIPVIIAAMTKTELEKLTSATGQWAEDGKQILSFMEILKASDIGDLYECYGNKRELWHPFGESGQTIRELVDALIALHANLAFKAYFDLSDDFFSLNQTTRRTVWKVLSEERWFFLIVDSVSLYHRHIRKTLAQSLGAINPSNRVAIVVLTPLDATQHAVNKALLDLMNDEADAIITRYGYGFEPRVDILVGDAISLNRWLSINLERTRSEKEREMNPQKRRLLQEAQKATVDVGDLI